MSMELQSELQSEEWPSQYDTTVQLERDLGDPRDPDSALSFRHAVELDESERFPDEDLHALWDWGLNAYYVPEAYGGKLTSFEELLSLIRTVSRRDLSVSITDAHTFLGSVPIWIQGTEAQREDLGRFIIEENGTACLALTERKHGSDLMASSTTAVATEEGYRLNGKKWPINKASKTDKMAVLARVGEEKGARSLSLFLVDKNAQAAGSYSNLPKIKTQGIRCCDISGISFDDYLVQDSARVGDEGSGVEGALKGFHITRTMCAALSLGAADTALRTTVRFALERDLYGDAIINLSHVRHTLAAAYADLLVCDCMGTSAARGIHAVPRQLSTWSAIVKYFVPVTVEDVIQQASVVLGARHYLRDAYEWGIFQKLKRDNSVISLFDGSTVINLHAIILRLKLMARVRQRYASPDASLEPTLQSVFDLRADLPPLALDELDLLGRGDDLVLRGLPVTAQRIDAVCDAVGVTSDVAVWIEHLVGAVQQEVDALDAWVLEQRIKSGHDQPKELFDAAKKYCRLHAAASCIHTWVHNATWMRGALQDGTWLVFALRRLLASESHVDTSDVPDFTNRLVDDLEQAFREDRSFGIVDLPLAGALVAA